MNTKALSGALVASMLSLAGLTLYAQGFFTDPDASSAHSAQKGERQSSDLSSNTTVSNVIDAAKEAQKTSSSSSALSNFNQTVTLGPGVDREIYLIKTTGQGTLTATLKQLGGTLFLFKLEITPEALSEKKDVNQVGTRMPQLRAASFHTNTQQQNLQGSTQGALENAGAALFGVAQQGSAPLSASLALNGEKMKDLKLIVASQNGEGSAALEFSGDANIISITKKEFAPSSLSPAGKIIVPLVMHEFDRYFQGFPGGENTLDTAIAQRMAQTPLASQKLQNTVARFKNFSTTKKNTLFHPKVVSAIESVQGGKLSKSKVSEIQGLLASVLPPKAPTNVQLSFSTKLTTSQGGKKLTLAWKHKQEFVTSYVIERALAADIEQDMDIGSMEFTLYKTRTVKKARGKKIPTTHTYVENVSSAVHSYCYRVKAVNANGSSAYSNVVCPQQIAGMVKKNYNVKWTRIHTRQEAAVDGLSNSDEPYLVFTMINGLHADGTPRVWTRSWTGADDVDTFESEPDEGQAHFTLFGQMPQEAAQELSDLRAQLANTSMYTPGTWNINPAWQALVEQINSNEWGTKAISSPDAPAEIDLSSGLITSIVMMEHDDGAAITLEEQIKAGIYAAMDVAEAFASPDPYHIAEAVKSSLEFIYTLWANDDYIGSETWALTYWDAWAQATPPNGLATKRFSVGELGSDGEYNIDVCYYPQTTQSIQSIKTLCTLAPPY